MQHHARRVDHGLERPRRQPVHTGEHGGAPALGGRGATGGARSFDRLPYRAHHDAAGVRRDERRDVGFGEQGLDRGKPATRIGHGGLRAPAAPLLVSRATGTTSTPCASAATPLKFVAPRIRTKYLPPGASGRAVCTTSRSDGTGRCLRSLRTRLVSTRAAVSRGAAGAPWAAAEGAAAPRPPPASRLAVVSRAFRRESATARARAWIESYCPAPYSVRTGNGVVSGSANTRDRKSTRLNSSHITISYAVFCLKKKKK